MGTSTDPERIRQYTLIVTRDILPPLTGVFLSVYLPLAGEFSAWQLPLIAGLLGIPLVAPRPPKAQAQIQGQGTADTVDQIVQGSTPARSPDLS